MFGYFLAVTDRVVFLKSNMVAQLTADSTLPAHLLSDKKKSSEHQTDLAVIHLLVHLCAPAQYEHSVPGHFHNILRPGENVPHQ
ncbi:Uncharacterised protein [Corynebacterium kutscheri]|nr:Uncharacterised protein [Corynebacterium kutscheri]